MLNPLRRLAKRPRKSCAQSEPSFAYDPLDEAVLSVSPYDVLTRRDLHRHTLCRGVSGSGKSSTVAATIYSNYLASSARPGALIVTAKVGDRLYWQTLAERVLEEAIEQSHTGFLIERRDRPIVSIRKSFASACQRANLESVTPYTLRHTGATLLLAAGVPIRQVAGMLGHTEERTTELYGKHHVDFLGMASSKLDELFPSHAPDTRQFRVVGGQENDVDAKETACNPLKPVVIIP